MQDIELLNYLQSYLTPRRRELFEKVLSQRTNHFTVVTEDVYQLHNTSAVIRSCDVFGVQNIHVVEERNRKRIDREIAMGAQKWVSVNRHHTIEDAITKLKTKGYRIVATSPHAKDSEIKDFDISKPAALFFGTEKDGLSDIVMEKADAFVKIPMVGFTESLNISVSAAIILQELTSRLRDSNIDWRLPEDVQFDIKMEWTKKTIKSVDKIIERYVESRIDEK